MGLYEGEKDWEIVDATRAIASERGVPMAQIEAGAAAHGAVIAIRQTFLRH